MISFLLFFFYFLFFSFLLLKNPLIDIKSSARRQRREQVNYLGGCYIGDSRLDQSDNDERATEYV